MMKSRLATFFLLVYFLGFVESKWKADHIRNKRQFPGLEGGQGTGGGGGENIGGPDFNLELATTPVPTTTTPIPSSTSTAPTSTSTPASTSASTSESTSASTLSSSSSSSSAIKSSTISTTVAQSASSSTSSATTMSSTTLTLTTSKEGNFFDEFLRSCSNKLEYFPLKIAMFNVVILVIHKCI